MRTLYTDAIVLRVLSCKIESISSWLYGWQTSCLTVVEYLYVLPRMWSNYEKIKKYHELQAVFKKKSYKNKRYIFQRKTAKKHVHKWNHNPVLFSQLCHVIDHILRIPIINSTWQNVGAVYAFPSIAPEMNNFFVIFILFSLTNTPVSMLGF